MQVIWLIQWDWDFVSCEVNGSEVLLLDSSCCDRGHLHTLADWGHHFSGQWGWSSRAEAHLPHGSRAERGTPAHCCSSLRLAATLLLRTSVSVCLLQWVETLGSAGHEYLKKTFLVWLRALSLFFFLIQPAQRFVYFCYSHWSLFSCHCRGTQSSFLQNSV